MEPGLLEQLQQAGPLPSLSNNNHCGIWEPFPIEPHPDTEDRKRRFESLQAFLDWAQLRSSDDEGEEEIGERTSNKNNKRIKNAEEEEVQEQDVRRNPTNDSAPPNEQQIQGASITDILNMDYSRLPRIRDYQEQVWQKHYTDLLKFHQKEGHCCVPHSYKENPELARWVKRQRYQYKLLQQGAPKSTMVPHRVQALEQLGFVWDSHAALWEEQFHELKIFKMLYDHCNVPSIFPANPQLSTWVKRQRRLYREHSMPKSREEKLVAIGFDWKTR